jgi:hypothetical protein
MHCLNAFIFLFFQVLGLEFFMSSIAKGDWAIQCVLINDQTVMNNDSIRALEVLDREWVIQPAGQRFKICQLTSTSAILESNGETFYADFEVDGGLLKLQLSRQNVNEAVTVEAFAITADVYSSMV